MCNINFFCSFKKILSLSCTFNSLIRICLRGDIFWSNLLGVLWTYGSRSFPRSGRLFAIFCSRWLDFLCPFLSILFLEYQFCKNLLAVFHTSLHSFNFFFHFEKLTGLFQKHAFKLRSPFSVWSSFMLRLSIIFKIFYLLSSLPLRFLFGSFFMNSISAKFFIKIMIYLLISLIFFVVLGFDFRASYLLGRLSINYLSIVSFWIFLKIIILNFLLCYLLSFSFFLSFFCGTGAWTQGLHFVLLHHPYFYEGFFEMGSCELLAWSGFKPQSS
jgi:hypothetical protein